MKETSTTKYYVDKYNFSVDIFILFESPSRLVDSTIVYCRYSKSQPMS